MCNTQSSLTLNETDEAQMSWCSDCQCYSLVYRSSCASFNRAELAQFQRVLDQLTIDKFCYDFLGQPYVILHSSRAYVGFCLSQQDVSALKRLIREAFTIHEVYQLIQS
ncbi:MAG: DUF6686 family protein [Cyclobacteriaceae bacterium]